MDKNYYFVLEPNGSDQGPYVLAEIRRRIELGLLSNGISLCRVGETDYVPATDDRYSSYFERPRRMASGTQPGVLEAVTAALNEATTVIEPVKATVGTAFRETIELAK